MGYADSLTVVEDAIKVARYGGFGARVLRLKQGEKIRDGVIVPVW